ncbi:hypothetical protein ACKI1J_38685 [Streptomyces scabiei]|uniref:hypothetical protein n=1 Tax=Streptomyces scabiei TaxID=1930 RepID=UPI0039EFB223
MPSPILYAGEIITADAWNALTERLVTQENDRTVTSATTGTTYVDSEITFTPEPNAVYRYMLLLSYSAYTTSDFKWQWSAAGASFSSFTQAYYASAGIGFNTGSQVIFRRPGNTTTRVAGGASDASNDVFLSAYDWGTFATDGTISPVTMQFAQNTSSADPTILRGGNQTRMLYRRIR